MQELKESALSNPAPKKAPIRRHRTLFLSDLHLGAIGARADLVLRFLEQNRADTYMLVGDILDAGVPFTSVCFKDASGTSNPRKVHETFKEARKLFRSKDSW